MEKRRIIAYGAGKFFEENIACISLRYDVMFVCDGDKRKHERRIKDVPCVSPEEMKKYPGTPVLITAMNPEKVRGIREELKRHGLRELDFYEETNLVRGVNKKKRKMIIFGTMEECHSFSVKLLCQYSDMEIAGFATHDYGLIGEDEVSRKQVVTYIRAEEMVRTGDIHGVIAVSDTFGLYFVQQLFDWEVIVRDNFYIGSNRNGQVLFKPYRKSKRLGTVQFLVSPGCNLNCKLCSHFSPLVKEGEFYDFRQFTNDIERLKELVSDIDSISLLGGEAMLCPNLERYLYKAREVYPESEITIGTNGILIENMSDELICAMKETNCFFSLSVYPFMAKRIDEILMHLKTLQIRYFIDTWRFNIPRNDVFFRRYDYRGNNDFVESWSRCVGKACHALYNGKISACHFPVTAPYFNSYFGEELFDTKEDCIDLYDDELDSEKLVLLMSSPMKSCRYCHEKQYEKWDVIGKKSKIDDWVISP